MVQAALLGGILNGVLSTLPVVSLGNCCCLWIVLGGVLAAYIVQQNQPGPVTSGQGALVGLLAGVFGAVVWLAGAMVYDILFGPLYQDMLRRALDASRDMPPEVRQALEMMAEGKSPFRYVFGFLFQLLGGLIFSTLGGLLGAIFFHRDVPPAIGGEVPPPLPPQP